jgi:serine O-acetyltransferase
VIDFFNHLQKKYFNKIQPDGELLQIALKETTNDVNYHYKNCSESEVVNNIQLNGPYLSIFLYRLGVIYFSKNERESVLLIHGLLRNLCSCEFYFSTKIDVGFLPVHGLGSVIGSRSKIGSGFIIYQNCTIGHKGDGEDGPVIGDNVTLFPSGMILGNCKVGHMVTIAPGSEVLNDIDHSCIVSGNPATIIGVNTIDKLKKYRPNFL